jgi:DNA-3-methyladenine glycosylase
MSRLGRDFFGRDALIVAKDLLGKQLVIDKKEKKIGTIIETEAYIGIKDKACHASRGKTQRTKIMWGKPGLLYVYLVYGIHYMLNVIVGEKGFPAAVLIRGLSPIENISGSLNGPGKLTQKLEITKSENGIDAVSSNKIYFLDVGFDPKNIKQTPRIGIDYAGGWSKKPWRFLTDAS